MPSSAKISDPLESKSASADTNPVIPNVVEAKDGPPTNSITSHDGTADDPPNRPEDASPTEVQSQTTTAVATGPASTEQTPSPETNDVLDANVGDQPTDKDTLGFEPYVKAIAGFLINDQTNPPLTLSIEGAWGSGKSSFMLQLEKELRDEGSGIVTSFNAWRYDKDEAMWAAFALEFTQQLGEQLTFGHRWLAHLKLFFLRYDWEKGWRDLVKLGATLILFMAILVVPVFAKDRIIKFVFSQNQTSSDQTGGAKSDQTDGANAVLTDPVRKLIGSGGLLAYLVLVIGLGIKAKNIVGNPLTINLKKNLETPDYRSRVAFIKSFHEDFGKIVDVYAKGKKVYVFIDDLDRCEVPKAADLMQALNLMISDSSRLIFIMGMDREKVAAGLAVKYEKLLPYLAPANNDQRRESAFDPVFGLEYGYNFIEKFIQLPFLIPQPSEPQVKGFLEYIFAKDGLVAPPLTEPPTLQAAHAGEQAERTVTEDTAMVTDILKMVAPTFDYNPRRLKQFINAFRLKTFIASRTGLFGAPSDATKYDPLTTRQLGKFVAISLRWPLLLADLDDERDLLARLQTMVLGNVRWSEMVAIKDGREELNSQITVSGTQIELSERLARWYRRDGLRKLLATKLTEGGRTVDSSYERMYSLKRLDVDRLLQVSLPSRAAPTVAAAAPEAS